METKSDGAQVKAQQQDPQTAESRPSAAWERKSHHMGRKAIVAAMVAVLFAIVPLYVLATDSGDVETEAVEQTTTEEATTEEVPEQQPAQEEAPEQEATTPSSDTQQAEQPQEEAGSQDQQAAQQDDQQTEEPTEYASERTPVGTLLGTQSVDGNAAAGNGDALLTTQATGTPGSFELRVYPSGSTAAPSASTSGSMKGALFSIDNTKSPAVFGSDPPAYYAYSFSDGKFLEKYVGTTSVDPTVFDLTGKTPYGYIGYQATYYNFPLSTITLPSGDSTSISAFHPTATRSPTAWTTKFKQMDNGQYGGSWDGYIEWKETSYEFILYNVGSSQRIGQSAKGTWDGSLTWPTFSSDTTAAINSGNWAWYAIENNGNGSVSPVVLDLTKLNTPGKIFETINTSGGGDVDPRYKYDIKDPKTVLKVGAVVTYENAAGTSTVNGGVAYDASVGTNFILNYDVIDPFNLGSSGEYTVKGTDIVVHPGDTLQISVDGGATRNITAINGVSVSIDKVVLKPAGKPEGTVSAGFAVSSSMAGTVQYDGAAITQYYAAENKKLTDSDSSAGVTGMDASKFAPAPNTGYTFTGWKAYETADGTTRGAEAFMSATKTGENWPLTVTMDKDYIFVAQFAKVPSVYFGANPSVGGTVSVTSASAGISGSNYVVPSGTGVTATANSGYVFDGWKVYEATTTHGKSSTEVLTSATKTAANWPNGVTLPDNKDYYFEAQFTQLPTAYFGSAIAGGSVTPTSVTGFAKGDKVSTRISASGITVTPPDGYEFTHWNVFVADESGNKTSITAFTDTAAASRTTAWLTTVSMDKSYYFEAQFENTSSTRQFAFKEALQYTGTTALADGTRFALAGNTVAVDAGSIDPNGSGYTTKVPPLGAGVPLAAAPPITQTDEQSKQWALIGYLIQPTSGSNYHFYTPTGILGDIWKSSGFVPRSGDVAVYPLFKEIATVEFVNPEDAGVLVAGGGPYTLDIGGSLTIKNLREATELVTSSVMGSAGTYALEGTTYTSSFNGEEYVFRGWKVKESGATPATIDQAGIATNPYKDSDRQITSGGMHTYVAQWEHVEPAHDVTLHFKAPSGFSNALSNVDITVPGVSASTPQTISSSDWTKANTTKSTATPASTVLTKGTTQVKDNSGNTWTFDGWYDASGNEITSSSTITSSDDVDQTFTAKFKRDITIRFLGKNGTVTGTNTRYINALTQTYEITTTSPTATITGTLKIFNTASNLILTPDTGYETPASISNDSWHKGNADGSVIASETVNPFTTAVSDDTYYYIVFTEKAKTIDYTINRFYERAAEKTDASGPEKWWEPAPDNGDKDKGNAGTKNAGESVSITPSAADSAAHLPTGFSAKDYDETTTTAATDPTTVSSVTLSDTDNAINIYYKRKTTTVAVASNPSGDTDLRNATVTIGTDPVSSDMTPTSNPKRGETVTLGTATKTGKTLTWVITDGTGKTVATVPTGGTAGKTYTIPSGDDGVDKLTFTATWDPITYNFTVRSWDVTGKTLSSSLKPADGEVSTQYVTTSLRSGSLAYDTAFNWDVATGMNTLPSSYEVVGYALSTGGSAYQSSSATVNVAANAIDDLKTYKVDADNPDTFHVVVYYRTTLHDVSYNLDATVAGTSQKLGDLVEVATAGTAKVQHQTTKSDTNADFVDPVYKWKSGVSDAVKAKYSTTGKPDGAPNISWHITSATGTSIASPSAYLKGLSNGLEDDITFYATIGEDQINKYTITFVQPAKDGLGAATGWLGSSAAEKADGYTLSKKVEFGTTVDTAFGATFPTPEASDSTTFSDKWEISINGTTFDGPSAGTYYTAAQIKALAVDGVNTIKSTANYAGDLYIRPHFDTAQIQIQIIRHFQKLDGTYTSEAAVDAKRTDGAGEADYTSTVGSNLPNSNFTTNASANTKRVTAVSTGIDPKYYKNYSSGAITTWSYARAQKAGDASSYETSDSAILTVSKTDYTMHVFYDLDAKYTVSVQWDVANKYVSDVYGGTEVTLDDIVADLKKSTPDYTTWSDTKTTGGATKAGAAPIPTASEATTSGVVSSGASGYRLGNSITISDKYQLTGTVASGAKRNHYTFLGYIVKYPDGSYEKVDAPTADGQTRSIAIEDGKLGSGTEFVITGIWQRDYLDVIFKPGDEGMWGDGTKADRKFYVKFASNLNNAMTANASTGATGAITTSSLSALGLTQDSSHPTYKSDGTWLKDGDVNTTDAATVVSSSVTANTTWVAVWSEGATVKYLPGEHGSWTETTETYPKVATGKDFFDPADYGNTPLTSLSLLTYAGFASVDAGTAGGISGGNKDDATKVDKGYDLVGWYWDDNGTGRYTYISSSESDKTQKTFGGKTYTYANMPSAVGEKGYTFTAWYRPQTVSLQVNLTETGLTDTIGNAMVKPETVALATGTGAYGSASITIPGSTDAYSVIANSSFSKVKADSTMDAKTITTEANTKYVLPSSAQISMKGYTLDEWQVQQRSANEGLDASLRKATEVKQDDDGNWYVEVGNEKSVTIRAKYKPIEYNVTYAYNKTNSFNASAANFAGAASLNSIAQGNIDTLVPVPAATKANYGTWNAVSTSPAVGTVTFDDSLTRTASSTGKYEFEGWKYYTVEGDSTLYELGKGPIAADASKAGQFFAGANVTVYGTWKVKTVNVEFDVSSDSTKGNGSLDPSDATATGAVTQQVAFGGVPSANRNASGTYLKPFPTAQTGYVFDCWEVYTREEGASGYSLETTFGNETDPFESINTVTKDTRYVATFKKDTDVPYEIHILTRKAGTTNEYEFRGTAGVESKWVIQKDSSSKQLVTGVGVGETFTLNSATYTAPSVDGWVYNANASFGLGAFAGNQKGTTSLTVRAEGEPLKPEANVIELCYDPGAVTYYVARKYQQIDGSYLTFYDKAEGGESATLGDENKFTGNNEATISVTKDVNTAVAGSTHSAAAIHDEGTGDGQIHVTDSGSLWQWSSANGGNTVKLDKLDAANDDLQILTVTYDRPRYTFEFAVQDNAKWSYVKANNSVSSDAQAWARGTWSAANLPFVDAYAKIGTSTSRNAKVESNGVAHFDVLFGETITLPNMYSFVASAVGSFEGWRNTDTNTASKAYGNPYIVGKIDAGTVGTAQTILVAPEDAGATGVYHFEGTWSDRLWPVHIDASSYHYSADNSYVDTVAITGGTGAGNRVDVANGNYFTAGITDNTAKVEPGYTLAGWEYKMDAFTKDGSSYPAVTDWAPLSSFSDGTSGKTYSEPKDVPIYAETWFKPIFVEKGYTVTYKPAGDAASKAAFDFSLKGTAPTMPDGYTLTYKDGAIVFGYSANGEREIGTNMAAASALAVTQTGAKNQVVSGVSKPSNEPKTNKGYTFQGWHLTVTKADGTKATYTTVADDPDTAFADEATMDSLLKMKENADYLFEAVATENTFGEVQFNVILGNLKTPGNAATTMEGMKAGDIASVQHLPANDSATGWENRWTTKIFNNSHQLFNNNSGTPVAPVISGYTFKGWYASYTSGAALASQLATPLNFNSTIGDALGSNDKTTSAIQVYAYYEPLSVDVNLVSSLHNNLTAKYSSEAIHVGDKLDIANTLLPAALEETGYHFVGWSNYYTQNQTTAGYIMQDDGTFKNHFYTTADNYTVVAPYDSPSTWQSNWVTTTGSGASTQIVNNIYAHYALNTFNIQFTNGQGVGAWVNVTVPDALKDAYGTEYDVETQTLKNIPYVPMAGVTLEITGHHSALDRNSLLQVFDGWRLVSTDTSRNGNLLGDNDGKIGASVLQGSALSLFAADTTKGVQDGETIKVAPSFTSEATVSYNVNGGTVGAGVLGTGFTVGSDGDIGSERAKISGSGGTAGYEFKIGDNSLTKGSYTNLVPQNNQITRTGYTFTGWNTQANGQGQHYDYGQEVKLTDSQLDANKAITLYAEWGNLYTLYQVTPYFEELNADGSFKEFKEGTSFYIGSQSHAWVANADTNQSLLVQAGDESIKSGQTKNLDAAKAYMDSAFKSATEGFTLAESQADIDAVAGSGSAYTYMGSITADGTGNRNAAALKLYYTRDAYTLTYAYDFTSGSPLANRPTVPNPIDTSVTYKWGQPVDLRDIAANDPDDPASDSSHAYFNRVLKSDVQESWTVTYTDSGSTATATNTGGTFTMPKANVTATLTWTPAKVKVQYGVRTVKTTASNPGTGQLLVKSGSSTIATVTDESTRVQYEEVSYGAHPTLDLTVGDYAGNTVAAEADNVTDDSGKQYRYYFQGWEWVDSSGAIQTSSDLNDIEIWLADNAKDAGDDANVMTLVALFLESYSVNYENNGYGTFITSDAAKNKAIMAVQQGLDPSAAGIDTASPMTDEAYGWYLNGNYVAAGTAPDPADGSVKEPLHKNGVKFVGWKILGTNYNDAVSGGISQRIQGVVPVDGENPTVPSGYATLSSSALSGIYSSKINQNLTFTALWEEMEHTATFVADDFAVNANSTGTFTNPNVPSNYTRVSGSGNTAVQATFKFKADINAPTPTRTGYTFDGWKGSDGTSFSATDAMTMPADDVTYTAQWKVASGSVSYAVDGGSAGLGTVAPTSENVGYINSTTTDKSAAGATATPKAGYVFDKWTVGDSTTAVNATWVTAGPNGESTVVPQRNSDGVFDATTYYAHFKPRDYSLQFKLAPGVTSSMAVISGVYSTAQNYEFLKDIPAGQVLLTTNWKVDAKTGYTESSTWNVVMDNVPSWAYDENKSQFNSTATVTDYGDGTKKIEDVVADPSTLKLLGDTVFTKSLVANAVKIEFDTMGGSTAVSQITGVAGETGSWTVPDLSAADKPGYRFLGWIYDTQDNASAKAADLFKTTSAAYGKDPKQLTGADTLGATPTDSDVFDLSAITLQAGTTNTITTLPTEDHVYYAVWVPKWITITYTADAEDGTNPDGTASTPDVSQSTWYAPNKLTTLPGSTFSPKAKEGLPAAGQVFQYWQSNDYQPAVSEDEATTVQRAEAGKGKETNATNTYKEQFTIPTSDVTWHAKWTTRTVKLILDANGGNYGSQGAVVTIEQPWGSSYILPLVNGDRAAGASVSPLGDHYFSPQSGYTFTGWYTNRNKAKPTTGPDADWMLNPGDGEDFQLNASNYVMREGTATEAVRDEVHLYATWDVEGKSSRDLSYPVIYQSTDPVTGDHAVMSELNTVVYDDMTTTTNLYKGSGVPTKYGDIAGQLKFEGWVLTKTSGGTSGETLITDTANMSFEDAAVAAGYAREGGTGEFQGLEGGLTLTEKWSWTSFDVVFHNGWNSPDIIVGDRPANLTYDADTTSNTMPKCTWDNYGKKFVQWRTGTAPSSDGTVGSPHADSDTGKGEFKADTTQTKNTMSAYVQEDGKVHLYAMWEDSTDTYTLVFVNNKTTKGTEGASVDLDAYNEDNEVKANWTILPRVGYTGYLSNVQTTVPKLGTTDRPLVDGVQLDASYTFTGWFTQKNGKGVKVDDAALATTALRDIVDDQYKSMLYAGSKTVYLYAQWENTGLTIDYDLGSIEGTPVTGIPPASQSGSFNARGQADFTMATTGVTVDGWTADHWEVDFRDGNGTVSLAPGEAKTVSRNAAEDGNVGATVTATMVWVKTPQVLRYDYQLGDEQTKGWAEPGRNAGVPVIMNTYIDWFSDKLEASLTEQPYRFGYTAKDGWYKSASGNDKYASSETFADVATYQGQTSVPNASNPTKLFKQWVPNEYTVSYDPDGGTPTSSSGWYDGRDKTDVKFTDKNLVPSQNAIAKTGFQFKGWYYEDGDGAKHYVSAETKAGAETDPTYGSMAVGMATTTTAGVKSVNRMHSAIVDGGSLTLHAEWEEDTTTIIWETPDINKAALTEEGSTTDVDRITKSVGSATGEGLVEVTATPKPGYRITGWTETKAGHGSTSLGAFAAVVVAHNDDLDDDGLYQAGNDGSWTLDLSRYSSGNGGSGGAALWVNATYAPVIVPMNTTYTVKFYKKDADTGRYVLQASDTLPSGTDKLIAMNESTVRYDNGDILDGKAAQKYNAEGYKFIVGSVSGVDADGNAVSNQNQRTLTGDTATDELRLFYEPEGKNISYAYNEPGKRAGIDYPASTEQVAMPASQVAMVGQTVAPADLADWSPSVIGWTFKGWKCYSADGSTVTDIDDGFTMPNDDVVVYGEWERNIVEITILGEVEIDPYNDPGADDSWVSVTDLAPDNKIDKDGSWKAQAPFGSNLTTGDYEDYSTPFFKAKKIAGLRSADTTDTALHEVSVDNYTKGSFVLTWKYEYTSGPDSLDDATRTGTVSDPASIPLTGDVTLQAVLSKIHVVEYLPGDAAHGGVHGTWKNDLANTGNVGRDNITSGKTKYTDIPTGDAGYSIVSSPDNSTFQFDPAQVGRDGQPVHEPGYRFMGWAYLDSNGNPQTAGGPGDVAVDMANLDYSVTFIAEWEPTAQRVYLDSNGATNKTYSPTDVYASDYTGATVALPHDLTRPGFAFAGWGQYDDEGNLVKSWGADADLSMPGEDIELVAIWQATSVSIEYQASKGGAITGNTSEVLKSDATAAVGSSAVADPGYRFSKWTKNSDSTDLGFPASSIVPAGPFASGDTFIANFEPIDYLVVFNDVDTTETDSDARSTVLGGSALRNGNEQLVAFGDKINSGYDKTTDKPYLVFTNPNYVEPLPKPWKVEMWYYDESDERPSTEPDSIIYTDDLDEVEVKGYTEVTPYARMVLGDYTVRFETFPGGTAYTDLHVSPNEYNLAAGKSPKRTGFKFDGWAYKGGADDGWTDWIAESGQNDNWTTGSGADYESDKTYEWVAQQLDSENSVMSITLYAKWSLLSDLVVNYDMDGGDPVKAHDTDAHGSADNKLANVKYTDAGFGSVYDEDDEPDGLLESAPSKTGYFFAGWRLQKADGSGLVDDVFVTDQDFGTLATLAGNEDATEITLVAQWQAVSYEVWFYDEPTDATPSQKSSDIGLAVELTTNNFNSVKPPEERKTQKNGGKSFAHWLYKPAAAGGAVTLDVADAMTFEDIANDTDVSLTPDADGNPPHIDLYGSWNTLSVYYNEYHLLTADVAADGYTYTGDYTDTYPTRANRTDPLTEADAAKGEDPYTLKQWKEFTGSIASPQTPIYSTKKSFPGFTLITLPNDPAMQSLFKGSADPTAAATAAMELGIRGSGILESTVGQGNADDNKVRNATKFVYYYKENTNYRIVYNGNEGEREGAATIPSSIPSDETEKQDTEWKDRYQKSWTGTNNIPDDPTRPGYTFVGWSNTPDPDEGYMPLNSGENAEQAVTVSDENGNKDLQLGELTYSSPTEESDESDTIELFANWEENTANIIYRVSVDGKVNATQGGQIKLNDGVDELSPAERTESVPAVTGTPIGATAEADPGYTFQYWRLDQGYSQGAESPVKANDSGASLSTSSVFDTLGSLIFGNGDDAVLSTQAAVNDGDLVNVGEQYATDEKATILPGFEGDASVVDYNIFAQAVYTAVFVANEGATITYWPNPQSGDKAADMRSSYPYSQGDGLLQGQTVNIMANEYVSKYYTFAGWNTKADGSGESYAPGEEYKIPVTDKASTLDLYAQWTPKKFNVAVLASTDKEGGTVPATTVKATYGDQSSLSSLENYPHKAASGRSFLGWKVTYVDPTTGKTVTQHDLYTGDLADLKIQGNTTIEAVWGNRSADDSQIGTGGNYQVTKIVNKKGKEIGKITVDNGKTVTFLDADDKVLAVEKVKKGKVVAPDPPKIKGKVFVGWMIQSYDKKGNAYVKAVYKPIKTTTTTTTTTTTVTRTRTGGGPGGIIGAASETIGGILVKTGDNAPILICVAALALAGIGLIALRRRKDEEEEGQ